jgi:hypothetical protein
MTSKIKLEEDGRHEKPYVLEFFFPSWKIEIAGINISIALYNHSLKHLLYK